MTVMAGPATAKPSPPKTLNHASSQQSAGFFPALSRAHRRQIRQALNFLSERYTTLIVVQLLANGFGGIITFRTSY
jgi:hypothetical protein